MEVKTFTSYLHSKTMRILIVAAFLILMPASLFAQNVTVKGVVTSVTDGEPMIGVNVTEEGTTNGTITDFDGKFSLSIKEGSTLKVSFIGYIAQTVKIVPGKLNYNFKLSEDSKQIDEVVVVGYGVQKKKLVTGATVQVDGESISKLNTVNVLSALQTQTPGLNITQTSGQPGEGFKINVRGKGTNSSTDPLYVIDGVAGGDINSINPSDIKSVDILKDAASAAIYGARAANGVVLVTTIKGESGKPQVSYDGYYGVQNVYKMLELLDANQYMNVMDVIQFNSGSKAVDWVNFIGQDMYDSIKNGTYKGTNWLEAIRNEDAPIQSHSFNISGGNEISKFSMGYSYMDQEGIFGKPVQSQYSRHTVRLNSDHVLLRINDYDAIKVGQTLYYKYSEKGGIGIGNQYWNDISNCLRATPLMPVYNSQGGFFNNADKKAAGLDKYWNELANPVADMVYQRGNNISRNHNMQASAYLEIQPVRNLKLRSQFGYKYSSSSFRQFTPEFSVENGLALSSTMFKNGNSVQQTSSQGYDITLENTLSYAFEAKESRIDVLVGQAIEKSGMGETMDVTGSSVIWNDFAHAYLTNSKTNSTMYGAPWGEGRLASFFGRVNYNYKERYMFTAIMRADGSSNFMRGNRWGYFPSVSGGWTISEESFMEDSKNCMDFLKIRASWGQNGNCNIPNFNYVSMVSFDEKAAYSFGNEKTTQSVGGYAKNISNPDVTWETSEQLNIGFDARFLNSRLGLNFDWYKKTTVDWLVISPILDTAGADAPYINGGDVENTGVEIALNWNDRIGKDFTYNAGVSVAYNKNEVVRISNAEGIINGLASILSQGTSEVYRCEVGHSMGYFWGYKTAGVFQNQSQIDEYVKNNPTLQSKPQPGDLIFVDANGDKTIDENDKVDLGNPNPDYIIGINLGCSYKGFDLSVSASAALGMQNARSYRKFSDSFKENYTTEVFDYWHGEGTSNKYPRLTEGANTNWLEISDIYIEDADYLKIRNVTIGYDFKRLFPKMPLGQARLYFTAQNLFTFTNYKGMDPEIGTSLDDDYPWAGGIDVGFYPSPRTYMVGVNLKF